MEPKQDIATVAEIHAVSYIDVILSPAFTSSVSRATKMASYFLPTITVLTDGEIAKISDPAIFVKEIAEILAKLETDGGLCIEEKRHRVEVVSEGSAIVWITFGREAIVWTNLYFFRRMENGGEGWEGGITDGEMGMLRQLKEMM